MFKLVTVAGQFYRLGYSILKQPRQFSRISCQRQDPHAIFWQPEARLKFVYCTKRWLKAVYKKTANVRSVQYMIWQELFQFR